MNNFYLSLVVFFLATSVTYSQPDFEEIKNKTVVINLNNCAPNGGLLLTRSVWNPKYYKDDLNQSWYDKIYKNVLELNKTGTGFFIKKDNKTYVITNHHVVNIANDTLDDSIVIQLFDKQTFTAKWVDGDPFYDLAILELSDTPRNLPVFRLATAPKIGEKVWAIGHPDASYYRITEGVVEDVNFTNPYTGQYSLIRHTAELSKGNSGGPLVNEKGELVGINVAILDKTQYVAIGIPLLHKLLESTNQSGNRRAYIGIECWQYKDSPPFINGILPNSPASKYLQNHIGNYIVSINNRKVNNATDLLLLLEEIPPHSTIKLGIRKTVNANTEYIPFKTQALDDKALTNTANYFINKANLEYQGEKPFPTTICPIDVTKYCYFDRVRGEQALVAITQPEKYSYNSKGWLTNTKANLGAAIRLSSFNSAFYIHLSDASTKEIDGRELKFGSSERPVQHVVFY